MRRSACSSVRGLACRRGVSLVEVLVVIAIVGILVSLIAPAVQSSREAARVTACRNNLRQIGIAFHSQIDVNGAFASNGWGFLWSGEPGRGASQTQPGGWIYSLLPHVEQSSLHGLGAGVPELRKREILAQRNETPIALFNCVSRPSGGVGMNNPHVFLMNAEWTPMVAKTDYAVNEGDFITDTPGGPPDLATGDSRSFVWTEVSNATGVSYLRSAVRPRDISDGMSQTYLVGEKYVSRAGYGTANDSGHDQPMYSGVDLDINRWTIEGPKRDADESGVRRFGSAHAGGCHFLMCDGSVQNISYGIDSGVHRSLGNRRDSLPIGEWR